MNQYAEERMSLEDRSCAPQADHPSGLEPQLYSKREYVEWGPLMGTTTACIVTPAVPDYGPDD